MINEPGGASSYDDATDRIASISTALIAKRTSAIDYRRASGIEDTWARCEDDYQGIDDLNRGERKGAKWYKSPTLDGPILGSARPDRSYKSTIFPRIAMRYANVGKAKLIEAMCPPDELGFSIAPSPVPDLDKADGRAIVDDNGQPMLSDDGVPKTVGDLASEVLAEYEKAAKKAEKRILDWMVASDHRSVFASVAYDLARLGVGIIKGPYPQVRRHAKVSKNPDGISMEVVEEIKPGEEHVSPWRFYPAPGCGNNVQRAEYVFEYASVNRRTVEDLLEDDTYIEEQIRAVLKDGPDKSHQDRNDNGYRGEFPMWFFYGALRRSDVDFCNGVNTDDDESIDVIATLINDKLVKVIPMPEIQSPERRFPYNVGVWEPREDHWAGIGVVEQCFEATAICKGAARAMLTNAGNSGGGQVVMSDGIEAMDRSDVITPDKLWRASPEVDDVRKAFEVYTIPNVTQQMLAIIAYGERLAEESTSIPLVTQGQSGLTTPDTYGQSLLQHNNANQLLRAVVGGTDDKIIKPLINGYYDWLMRDPDIPDDEKGDYEVQVTGSTVLVERYIQSQELQALGQVFANPAFGLSQKKWAEELLRSKRFDPRRFQMDEEEKKMLAQPAPPPQVQAAQIRASADLQMKQIDAQTGQLRIKMDTDRDTAYVNAEAARVENERRLRIEELRLKLQIAQLEFASKNQISIDELKTKLASDTMKIDLQRELSGVKGGQVLSPPVEPPGRAEDGRAYEQ